MVSLHGEPCLKSFLDGFPSVFDPSWSQSCQNGFPIVQLMFLYEARARARLVQEHQLHNWDPIGNQGSATLTFWHVDRATLLSQHGFRLGGVLA